MTHINLARPPSREIKDKMEINKHKEKLADTGEEITAFEVTTRKGMAVGFLHGKELVIHHISGEGCIKGIMSALCKSFDTTKFRFTMITNPKLKEIIKGEVYIVPADAKGNPFGEPVENIRGNWIL